MKTFRNILSEVAEPRSADEMSFRDKHLVQIIHHPVSDYKQHTGDVDGDGVQDKRKKHKRPADYKKGEDQIVYEEIDPSDEASAQRIDRARMMQIKKKIIDEKKLDTLGKEDDDIDNDGDVDSSDSYLHGRRRAITAAIRNKYHRESIEINEKAVSQAQQKAAAIALAVKKGKLPKSKLQGASKDMLGMSKKDLEDFARTKLNGLPLKVYEDLDEAVSVEKKNYSWGRMMTVHHGSSHSFPLHPEHQEAIKNLKDGESTSFKDETRRHVTATRQGDKVHLKTGGAGSAKTTVAHSHFTESVELDEARKSSSYQFTHKPGDPESEKRLADLKQSVKGSGRRVVLQGRLGKDNPNAHKYSKNAPRAQYRDGKRINADVSGKSGAHSHQRIQKADAAHHDVYVYDRNESVELDEISTEKMRDYASAALQDKNKMKADKRWKYASKAMNIVADRDAKALHNRKCNKMEEVELDEAETNYVIKHKKTKQVLNTHSDYATAKDEHEGLGADKHEYGIYKQTKKDAALRNRNTYREEVEQIDEISKSTLGSYAKKALQRGDIAARMSHSDSDEMGKIADKRLAGVKKAVDRIAPKAAASRIKSNIDKARESARNRDNDKNDQGKAYYAAQKGIAKVREDACVEEVELNELSPSTLDNYYKAASKQLERLPLKRDEKDVKKSRSRLKYASKAFYQSDRKKREGMKESAELDEAFKTGPVKLNDGSSVILKDQDAKLMNQLFADLNANNKKKMLSVAMTDKAGFNEILGFAREAL